MDYAQAAERLNDYRRRIEGLRKEMRQVQAKAPPQEVEDYRFKTPAGEVALSELFGDKDALFVIHNMGTGCNHCTLWADGFNGVIHHLENRAAFVLASPDDPETQAAFAAARGWRFRMVSHQGSSFAEDMGYRRNGKWRPGVSVFKRDGTRILRVSDTAFDEGDDFCATWHLLDLLPEGKAGWAPRRNYDTSAR